MVRVGARAQSRRSGAPDVACRSGGDVGRRRRDLPHGKQSSHSQRFRAQAELWRLGRKSLAPHAAAKSAAERPEDIQTRRQTNETPRYAGQDERQSHFWTGCECAGMLVAVVARPPVFGAKLQNFKAEKAKTIPGVQHVVEIARG